MKPFLLLSFLLLFSETTHGDSVITAIPDDPFDGSTQVNPVAFFANPMAKKGSAILVVAYVRWDIPAPTLWLSKELANSGSSSSSVELQVPKEVEEQTKKELGGTPKNGFYAIHGTLRRDPEFESEVPQVLATQIEFPPSSSDAQVLLGIKAFVKLREKRLKGESLTDDEFEVFRFCMDNILLTHHKEMLLNLTEDVRKRENEAAKAKNQAAEEQRKKATSPEPNGNVR